jgi:hypothetical protein
MKYTHLLLRKAVTLCLFVLHVNRQMKNDGSIMIVG